MDTKELLVNYYRLSEVIPKEKSKSKWTPENKFGLLLGIIAHGEEAHISTLHNLLVTEQFQEKEESFVDSMFDYYIRKAHKSYNSEHCQTDSAASSRPTSRRSSKTKSKDDSDYVPQEKPLSHNDLKKALLERDKVCMFCWNRLECEAAHLIAQKNIPFPFDGPSLLQQAGLTQMHQVQNGLLLCIFCHSQFDKLKRYVDVVDKELVVKIVNETDDKTSEKHLNWIRETRDLKIDRGKREKDWSDERKAVESNGEMALYFVDNNPITQPNRTALEFHKRACLIWRMAGGAEPDDEYCSDDDDVGPVDTAALKRRFNIQDSAVALLMAESK